MHVCSINSPYSRAKAMQALTNGESVRSDRGYAWRSKSPATATGNYVFGYVPHYGAEQTFDSASQALDAFERHYNAAIPNS